eukprot:g4053.t1
MDRKSVMSAWLAIPRPPPHLSDNRIWTLTMAISVSGFGLYALYRHDRVTEFSSKVRTAVKAGRNAMDVLSKLTEISGTLLTELQDFLQTDSKTLPKSVRQISVLMSSSEFRKGARSLVMAFFEGLALSGGDRTSLEANGVFENLVEKIIEKATTRPDLLSIAVRVATRNAAEEIIQALRMTAANGVGGAFEMITSTSQSNAIDLLISRIATFNGRRVMSTVVTAFTTTLATVCFERMQGTNSWDEVFRVISRPGNRRVIHELLGCSTKEFARSMMECLAENRAKSSVRLTSAPFMRSEITEVDSQDNVLPSAVRYHAAQIREQADRGAATEAVSNLVQSVVLAARNDECRSFMFQLAGSAFTQVMRALVHDLCLWMYKLCAQKTTHFLENCWDFSKNVLYPAVVCHLWFWLYLISTTAAMQQ